MFTESLLIKYSKCFQETHTKLILQVNQQQEEIAQIQRNNEKTLEKFQKEFTKLQHTIEKIFINPPQQTLCFIDTIEKGHYQYELMLQKNLELPCYRNRIFSIRLQLVKENVIVKNKNKVLVELQIWTYDKIPKKLTRNNQGQSIYKGCQSTYIKEGKGVLDRIQVKEVSSHFPKGQFMLLIVPVDDSGIQGDKENLEIKKEWIKPLILHEIPIKAKKFNDRHIPYFSRLDGKVDAVTMKKIESIY